MHVSKPNRATHTYRQKLDAPPPRVFPLLCPVREAEWAEGWVPELVISSSGVAERDCVFVTPDEHGKLIWYVTRHEPARWFVEMLKILPGVTACRLEIQLSVPEDQPGDVRLEWEGHGAKFQLERATNAGGPYLPLTPQPVDSPYTDVGVLTNQPHFFYRLRQF